MNLFSILLCFQFLFVRYILNDLHLYFDRFYSFFYTQGENKKKNQEVQFINIFISTVQSNMYKKFRIRK